VTPERPGGMLASPASPTVGTQVETDQETSFKLSKTLLNAVPENWAMGRRWWRL